MVIRLSLCGSMNSLCEGQHQASTVVHHHVFTLPRRSVADSQLQGLNLPSIQELAEPGVILEASAFSRRRFDRDPSRMHACGLAWVGYCILVISVLDRSAPTAWAVRLDWRAVLDIMLWV